MNNFSLIKSMQYRFFKVVFLSLFVLVSGLRVSAQLKITQSATGMEVSEATVKAGEDLFKNKCKACHALDNKMVGPALKGVTERRSVEWLLKWVKNNEELRKSGDADANAIYKEFNGVAMNAFPDLTDDQIKSILMYTENGPLAQAAATSTAAEEVSPSLFKNSNWMLLLLAILIFIVIVLIIKTLNLVTKVTGKEVVPWGNINAGLFLLFLIVGMSLAFWEVSIHGKYVLIYHAASEHGKDIDKMMRITFLITGIVFVVTQILLFWFAFKYRAKKGVKALYYPHNDALEIAWTALPAIVLTLLVLGGLKTWKKINKAPAEGTAQIEVFAQQFEWKVRYPGADNKLGNANYVLISETTNPLGVAVSSRNEVLLAKLRSDIHDFDSMIQMLGHDEGKLRARLGGLVGKERRDLLAQIDHYASGKEKARLELQIQRRKTQIERIEEAIKQGTWFDKTGDDDIIGDEIHLVVDKPVTFKFRARDVIHSALMKEFRAQMNVVPGIPTQFTFTPTVTTAAKRDQLANQEFDYYIICNKICGDGHYNMRIKIVVETQDEYNLWMEKQKGYFMAEKVEETPAVAPSDTTQHEVVATEPLAAVK
ncbi:MAG: c-type cytochrome [Flavobacteriales bacterium]|nr:c-type cytochrome [Flavobacteriales bacterium]